MRTEYAEYGYALPCRCKSNKRREACDSCLWRALRALFEEERVAKVRGGNLLKAFDAEAVGLNTSP